MIVVAIDDLLDLCIDDAGGIVRHVLGLGHAAAEEDFTVLFCVKHGAETLGHAPLGHHLARAMSVARSMSLDAPVDTFSAP